MRNRVLALSASGLLLFGTFALAQDTSSPGSASQSDTGKTKANHSTKTSGAGATSATSGTSSDQSGAGSVAAADKKFMMKTAHGGLAEVQLGQLAADKATSPDVKQFGQRMVDDHSKANDQLKSVAQQKGVTLPTDLAAKDKAEKDRLSKLSGEQFDRAYMQHMVMDHKKDVAEFKKESKSAKDDDVKNFASQTLPTLQDHLKNAESVASKTGAMAANKGSKKAKSTSASSSNPQ